jgi:hypothetical protein
VTGQRRITESDVARVVNSKVDSAYDQEATIAI